MPNEMLIGIEIGRSGKRTTMGSDNRFSPLVPSNNIIIIICIYETKCIRYYNVL